MDITVYLPDRLGVLAKQEGLNLSRMLREAVMTELQFRGIAPPREFVSLDEATELIREIVKDGEWHSSRVIHEKLRPQGVREGHFGAAKAALGIEHRRVGWGEGSYFEWRLPRRERSDA